jgi:dTDP-4-amino-4,6-dideoxygalactose transaminase
MATNDEEMWSRAWAFKDHGKSYDAVFNREHPPGFRWLCESFGTNWRMTELQAAIGRIQLSKLPEWRATRAKNAMTLISAFKNVPGLRVPEPEENVQHAYYRFYCYVETAKLRAGWTRDRIVAEMSAVGLPCFSGSCSEVYREKAFDSTASKPDDPLPVARELGESSLAFLIHPTLSPEHMERVAGSLVETMKKAVR